MDHNVCLCIFINPYGIKAITYVFTSYDNIYMHKLILEMWNVSTEGLYGLSYIVLIGLSFALFRLFKNEKFQLRQVLLFLRLTYLALKNYRNIPLWIIGAMPYLVVYLKPYLKNQKTKKSYYKFNKNFWLVVSILLMIIMVALITFAS